MAETAKETWHILVCRVCDPDGASPIPFESPRTRGEWAGAHRRGTGHDSWIVLDSPRTAEEETDG